MDQQVYLKKLSYAVRWRLPKPEADEILADYEEIFSERPAEAEELFIGEQGGPLHAARLFTEPKVYRRWLVVFGCMAFCLLWPEFLLLRARFYRYPSVTMFLLLGIGTSAALIWFRPRRGERGRLPFPKGLCPMLVGLLLLFAAAEGVLAGLASGIWESLPPAWYGTLAYRTMSLAGTAAAALGLFGLVKARISDRRWRALYVMGLMILAECVLVIAVLVSMDISTASDSWWASYTGIMAGIGLMGLAGAGVSLC